MALTQLFFRRETSAQLTRNRNARRPTSTT
jgi:hypothetical protein